MNKHLEFRKYIIHDQMWAFSVAVV